MHLGCGPSGFHFLPSYQFGRPLPSEDQPFELSELCLNKTSSSEDSYSKTYKDESKSSTLMFNMTFLSDMEVDTKKKDESQPSRILASCRTSVDRVCSMEFLKERLLQHPTSSNLLYLLSLSLIHHHHWPTWKIGFPPLSGLPPTTWTCSLGTSLQESPPPSPSYHKE